MTKLEASYVAAFLDELSERFGNDGCNDMILPNSEENRDLVHKAQILSRGEEDAKVQVSDGRPMKKGEIFTTNSEILSYVREIFMEENGLTKEDLPGI